MHLFHKWIPIYEPETVIFLGEKYKSFKHTNFSICKKCMSIKVLKGMYGTFTEIILNKKETEILLSKLTQVGNKLVLDTRGGICD